MINYIVAASNIYGLLPIYHANGYLKIWMILAVLASVLMHLSETKHELKGVYPFNIYSMELLWFDRIMAYMPGLYFVLLVISNMIHYNISTSLYKSFNYLIKRFDISFIGLIFMMLSEADKLNNIFNCTMFKITPLYFGIMHSMWHICAYHTCYLFFINK